MHAVRLAVDLGEVVGHHGHVVGRACDRVGDQVREGTLRSPAFSSLRRASSIVTVSVRKLVAVESSATGPCSARAPRRCPSSPSSRPLSGGGSVRGGSARRRRGAVARRRVEHVGLDDPPGRSAAGDAREVDALGGRCSRGYRRDLRALWKLAARRLCGGIGCGGRAAVARALRCISQRRRLRRRRSVR